MYENMTYDIILARMLAKVTEWANNQGVTIDERVASLIYCALSPAAVEFQQAYIALDEVLDESFADTETRDFLIRRAAERGITPENATKAVRKGVFTPSTLAIPIGSRFSLNKLNYIVTSKIDDGEYQLQCETVGTVGNAESGALIPIDYIEGLQTATLTDVLIPGEDDETTEHLRQRYFDNLDSQAFGGNIKDYKEKTLSLDGVGGVKVYPVWNGGGTVKLVIVNSQFETPTQTLIDAVQTAIDPTQNQGVGMGLAPIGHVVTVQGVDETTVNISTHVTFQDGWAWEDILPYVQTAIDGYFKELSEGWEDASALVVRVSQIETRLLGLTGVLDVADTTLNGISGNLVLDQNAIPIRGTVTNA